MLYSDACFKMKGTLVCNSGWAPNSATCTLAIALAVKKDPSVIIERFSDDAAVVISHLLSLHVGSRDAAPAFLGRRFSYG